MGVAKRCWDREAGGGNGGSEHGRGRGSGAHLPVKHVPQALDKHPAARGSPYSGDTRLPFVLPTLGQCSCCRHRALPWCSFPGLWGATVTSGPCTMCLGEATRRTSATQMLANHRGGFYVFETSSRKLPDLKIHLLHESLSPFLWQIPKILSNAGRGATAVWMTYYASTQRTLTAADRPKSEHLHMAPLNTSSSGEYPGIINCSVSLSLHLFSSKSEPSSFCLFNL